jgi:hypothetical protein
MNKHVERFYHSFQALVRKWPYLSSAIFLVLGAHVALIIYAHLHKNPPLNPHRKRMIVKTMILPPEPAKPTFTMQEKSLPVVVAAPARAAHKKRIASIEKKSSPKTGKSTPSSTVNPYPASTPRSTSKTKQLLNELQESIAKIETNRDNILPAHTISVPNPISALKADRYQIQSENVEEGGFVYRDMLVHYLKDALHLPGYGTVKVELTLNYSGDVQNLAVIYSDSEINRLYLQQTLQNLSFPQFIGELCNKKTYTFCLTFCSDQ